MYKDLVKPDPGNHRIEIVFEGHMSEEDAEKFQQNLRSAVAMVRAPEGWFDMLADCTNLNILDKAVAASSALALAWCQENGLRRTANITSSALLKMQIERITPHKNVACLPTRAEAVAWLERD